MSIVRTTLRDRPIAAARDVSYAPTSGVAANNVQLAIQAVQANVATGSATPPALVPKLITFAMSPYTVLPTDYLLEVDTSGGAVSIQTQASASRANKPFTVKDIAGNASTNNISILRTGAETIDGLTTYPLATDFMAQTFAPKSAGNGYEVES